MVDNLEATSPEPPSPTPDIPRRSPSPSSSSPRPVPLIGFISLLVLLCSIVLLSTMTTSDLSHPRTAYYLSTLSARPPPRKLRFGSFNIRYSPRGPFQPLVSLLGKTLSRKGEEERGGRWGERKWEERREKLVDQVLFHELDVVGFQEVLEHQKKDLEALMGEEEWESVGVGRNDGKQSGESVPIFFRKSRFSLSLVSHYWLSPTPSKPGSRGWDAGQPRMITIAILKDLDAPVQEEIIVANTHWDDRGLEARTQSAKLIRELLEKEVGNVTREENGREPLVILMGDLNSPAEEEGYQVLTGGKYIAGDGKREAQEKEKAFWDSRHEVATRKTRLGGPGALSRSYGPLNTFTGFVPSDEPKIIDFVLLYDNKAFSSPHAVSSSGSEAPAVDTSYLDADDPDEVLASIPDPSPPPPLPQNPSSENENSSIESLLSSGTGTGTKQTSWKVSRYGVIPNFYEDVGGKGGGEDDGLIVSDHRLVVVALEEIVA
ncbi:endonuclease/exonuclease/phosphatase family protein [Sporobolomyces salmoneus]|uniref:endonuclease/exonuclease/phosphatase family protein n=1 Tax=Sporobolomyces salmoneus TaxID=183962 RepID=UPI00317C0B54